MHQINLLGSNVLLRENFVSFFIEVVDIFNTYDKNSCHHYEPLMAGNDCAIVTLSDETKKV